MTEGEANTASAAEPGLATHARLFRKAYRRWARASAWRRMRLSPSITCRSTIESSAELAKYEATTSRAPADNASRGAWALYARSPAARLSISSRATLPSSLRLAASSLRRLANAFAASGSRRRRPAVRIRSSKSCSAGPTRLRSSRSFGIIAGRPLSFSKTHPSCNSGKRG